MISVIASRLSLEEILAEPISLFRTIHQPIGTPSTFNDFIQLCQHQRTKDIISSLRGLSEPLEQKEYKTNNVWASSLSCVTGSSKSVIEQQNNLLVVDIDADDNMFLFDTERRRDFKTRLSLLPYVVYVSDSCRGNGIFVVIAVEQNDPRVFRRYFAAIEKDFADCGVKIDASCKNVNRLRFGSWDDGALLGKQLKEEGYVTTWTKELEPEPEQESRGCGNGTGMSQRPTDDFISELVDELLRAGWRFGGYDDWIKTAFALAGLGELGWELWHKVSRMSTGYKDEEDCRKKWNNIVKSRGAGTGKDSGDGTGILYIYSLAKKYLGPGWKWRTREKITSDVVKSIIS